MNNFLANYFPKLNFFEIVFCIFILVSISSLLTWKTIRKKKLKLPPGPVGLPVLGYLPFLGKEPYKTLHSLCKKYGNVFSLYLGRTYVVILGDYRAVVDAFSKSTTLDRPPATFDFLPDGAGFSGVNGQEWVEQRRYSVRAMRYLGLGKSAWEQLIEEEVIDFVQLIESFKGKPINICKLLTSSVSNNIASLVLGKRIPLGHPTRDFLDHSVDAVSQFFSQAAIRNYFPGICNLLEKFGIGGDDVCRKDMVAFNKYIRDEVEEHKKHFNWNEANDFIDGYLKHMEEKEKCGTENTFNDKNLCGNIQALLVGGSDTTRTSLNWLLLAMAIHPEIQEKIHKELDAALQGKQMASWEDRFKVPYTYAAIMEGQRWKTVAPLNTSRVAREDIQICGYDIPKGATIIANNWGLHNDEKYWKNPEEFIPERFLEDDGKQIIFRPESYVAFSYGKRNCPGETVAMIEMLLYFSALLLQFQVKPPSGQNVKLDAILGLTYQAVPQKLCLIPREEN